MKLKLKIILVIVILTTMLFSSCLVRADPNVSFTSTSVRNKVVLYPNLVDITHYRWLIESNKTRSVTGWIDYADRSKHISILDSGTYTVTLIGRNINSGLNDKFSSEVKVSVKVDEEETTTTPKADEGSNIIKFLPEPIKSFLKSRSDLELFLLIVVPLLLVVFLTRKKQKKIFFKVEVYNDRTKKT